MWIFDPQLIHIHRFTTACSVVDVSASADSPQSTRVRYSGLVKWTRIASEDPTQTLWTQAWWPIIGEIRQQRTWQPGRSSDWTQQQQQQPASLPTNWPNRVPACNQCARGTRPEWQSTSQAHSSTDFTYFGPPKVVISLTEPRTGLCCGCAFGSY